MIREALATDAQRLEEMGSAFFVEAGLPARGVSFDGESFRLYCGALAQKGILLVAERGGQVVGMIGVALLPAYWNLETILAQECFLWVDEGHRLGLGRKLVEAAEKCAISKGAVLCCMAAEHGLREEAVGQLFRRKGYAPSETLFWRRLDAGVVSMRAA